MIINAKITPQGLLPLLLVSICFIMTTGCSSKKSDSGNSYHSLKNQPFKKNGTASYYAHRFHGRKTASGERFDMHAMTAAHKTLKFGTRVKVTNKANGKSVIVRINDRGPYAKGRMIDVSYAAAKKLGMIRSGTAKVSLSVVR